MTVSNKNAITVHVSIKESLLLEAKHVMISAIKRVSLVHSSIQEESQLLEVKNEMILSNRKGMIAHFSVEGLPWYD